MLELEIWQTHGFENERWCFFWAGTCVDSRTRNDRTRSCRSCEENGDATVVTLQRIVGAGESPAAVTLLTHAAQCLGHQFGRHYKYASSLHLELCGEALVQQPGGTNQDDPGDEAPSGVS